MIKIHTYTEYLRFASVNNYWLIIYALEKFLNVVFVRVNTAKYSTEEFFEYLNASEYRYTDTPLTYQDFLKAVRSMRPTRFMVDYHFKDLFVFHAKAKSFLWASDVLQSKRATIQDKVGTNILSILIHIN